MTIQKEPPPEGVFPTAKEISDAVIKGIQGLSHWFSDTIVRPITKFIDGLTKETRTLWKETSRSVSHVEKAVSHTVSQVELVAKDYQQWSGHREQTFLDELTTFFDGVARLAEEVPKKADGLEVNLEKSIQPLIAAYLAQIPGVVLFGLDKALSGIVDWHNRPGAIAEWIEKNVPQLAGDPKKICPQVLDPKNPKPWEIRQWMMIATDLKNIVSSAQEVLPKDLSITAVGVFGGGTEVSSHPTRWPFILSVQILHMTETLLKRYVEQYGSCSNSAWKATIDAQLQELIDRK